MANEIMHEGINDAINEAMKEIEGKVTFDPPTHQAIKEILGDLAEKSHELGQGIGWNRAKNGPGW